MDGRSPDGASPGPAGASAQFGRPAGELPGDRAQYDASTIGTRITRRELVFILAFWMLFALVTVASRMFDPRGTQPQGTLLSPFNQLAIAESALWVLLTPAVFWLAARFPLDRGGRMAHLALYVAGGLVVLLIVSVFGDVMRDMLIPPRPGRRQQAELPWWNLAGRFWLLNDLIRYMGVLAAGLARSYSLRYRSRQAQAVLLQAQLAQAHLDALRRQLDPHFLFNTLHAISSLVERDPRGVRRMISRLGELLRHSIEGSSEPEIPLRQELDLLGRYLDIMQVRFQGQLQVEQRIDPRALDAMVPNLVLQPLAENAIKHGIGQLTGTGRLTIEAVVEGADTVHAELVLRVSDNGPGLASPDAAPALPSSPGAGSGLGLRNTVARLEQLYGPGERFTLTARPSTSPDGGGTVAEVRVPFHTQRRTPPGGPSAGGPTPGVPVASGREVARAG